MNVVFISMALKTTCSSPNIPIHNKMFQQPPSGSSNQPLRFRSCSLIFCNSTVKVVKVSAYLGHRPALLLS